ncbi:MAG: hypothetical protein EBS19_12790, partial [Spirochaetia bacterium]|nr:hypothetical protein [Spirochaetia bacterium]
DEKLKELALQSYQQAQVRKSNFPTEMVSLPSQGKVYPESNPLRSGQIEMKYMTAREEDILTSANLIRQGVVLDKLMQSLIVSPINYNDLVIGDKNSILIASRILGYGKDYEIDVACDECNNKSKVVVDLTTLPEKLIPEDIKQINVNEFEFTLPQSKRTVTFKFLTHGDEKAIQTELDVLKKGAKKDAIDPELSTRLKYMILSVDGNQNKEFINNFIDMELFAMDSRALRKYIKECSPDQKFEIPFTCSHCNHEEEALAFSIDSNFFWPNS